MPGRWSAPNRVAELGRAPPAYLGGSRLKGRGKAGRGYQRRDWRGGRGDEPTWRWRSSGRMLSVGLRERQSGDATRRGRSRGKGRCACTAVRRGWSWMYVPARTGFVPWFDAEGIIGCGCRFFALARQEREGDGGVRSAAEVRLHSQPLFLQESGAEPEIDSFRSRCRGAGWGGDLRGDCADTARRRSPSWRSVPGCRGSSRRCRGS